MKIKKIRTFLKNNLVLSLAGLLAIFSAVVVPPSWDYLAYINWQVLATLFCLMLVIGGLRESGVFSWLMARQLSHLSSSRQLAGLLILACFFLSMWITNDVALLTFVPFSLLALRGILSRRQIAVVVVLQTIAANLGSMCTPVGNPQNLYLYFQAQLSISRFIWLLLPFSSLSLLLLLISIGYLPKRRLHAAVAGGPQKITCKLRGLTFLGLLFLLSLLAVVHVLDYRLVFGLTVLAVALWRPRYFRYVDYGLLMTFVAFFVLVGNLAHLEIFHQFLLQYVSGHEFIVALLASQLISNVPAAILLSGFTPDYEALLLGTDIGGLGTLIASMASLISYGIYVHTYPHLQLYYLKTFTLLNLVYLLILAPLAYLWV